MKAYTSSYIIQNMSSDGDILAFETSVHDNMADEQTMLFNEKKTAFITDLTSNSGNFAGGQIQFDLATLNSQSQWVDLSQAVIEFPVKITVSNGAAVQTSAGINSVITKCGWASWIDSCQLMINGQTVQSAQSFENVSAQFRTLTSWSQDDLVKWGSSCAVALDDCTADADTVTNYSTAQGLGNAPSSMINGVRGFDSTNNQTTLFNKGVVTRSQYTNTDIAPPAATLQTAILGSGAMKRAGRSHAASVALGSAANGATLMSAYYLATVRLRDICDIDQFPLTKNLKGFLYLSCNGASVSLTYNGTNVNSAVSVQLTSGRSVPFTINSGSLTTANNSVPVITGLVDGQAIGAIAPAGPLLSSAKLVVPFYVANPKADAALSMSNHYFKTLDKLVNQITVPAGQTVNVTLSVGISNPERLIMLPMWQNLGSSPSLTNPELSAFDSTPMTSGPFATLQSLQVTVGNKQIFQNPIDFDYDFWIQEQSQMGLNGNRLDESTSGLLSQQLWEQNHRFYTVDIGRRMDSEDGASKSVQVSFTNPSPTYNMKVIAIVQYQKNWSINTATCQLSQV